MKNGEFVIKFEEGLHARPATEMVKICSVAKSEIQLTKEDTTVDPKSILGIMALGASKGEPVSISVEGEDEEEIFEKITEFFG